MNDFPRMHLNLFHRLDGHHFAAWRHPDSRVDRIMDIEVHAEAVKTAERGLMDSVFLADSPDIGTNPWSYLLSPFEPVAMLSALAMVTSHIGLIGTLSTTFVEPYNIARALSSLDHLSHGRAGWNVVTSQSLAAGANFSRTSSPDHEERYAMGRESLEIVKALWDSWDEDALVVDRATGVFVDPGRVHPIDHVGRYHSVKGPLDKPRSPQGHPLLVQAGSSPTGMAFGAEVADAIFTAQFTFDAGLEFARTMRELAVGAGRDPSALKILPGLAPLLGSTEKEAFDLREELNEYMVPEHSVPTLSMLLEYDLSELPLDALIPVDALPTSENVQGSRSRNAIMVQMIRDDRMTVRDLVRWHIAGRTHRAFAGTPEQLADEMQTWFEAGACDGFNIMPGLMANGLPLFVDHVVPELQRRGLFRTEYEETTLRGHYGLGAVERERVGA